ncbi:MAG TPA: TetR/AcrR family transcriptional regulator, partial [Isosphaeraceae bacterium]|nr:TetR/AcrR family transcriptional regulator [Isosphaeraceae bacterium]
AAQGLFAKEGFANATTRDIAKEAGIATGTLFNYFPTKEAIAMALVAEALDGARRKFEARPHAGGSLEEKLFSFIACELRSLKPHSNHLEPVLETALCPLARASASPEGESLRVNHLEVVERMIALREGAAPPSSVSLHVYWALYTGVLAFWARDASPHQEDTLALLDHSLRAFAGSLPQSKPHHA